MIFVMYYKSQLLGMLIGEAKTLIPGRKRVHNQSAGCDSEKVKKLVEHSEYLNIEFFTEYLC